MPRGPFPRAVPWCSFNCCPGGDNATHADLLPYEEHCRQMTTSFPQLNNKGSRQAEQLSGPCSGMFYKGPICPFLGSLEEGFTDGKKTWSPQQILLPLVLPKPAQPLSGIPLYAPEKPLHRKLGARHQACPFPELETEGAIRNERRMAETGVTAPGGGSKGGAGVHGCQ